MPSIKVTNQATSANALSTNPFRMIQRPSVISFYASCVTNSDTVSLSVANRDIVRGATPNIEISADVVDTDRDLILAREPVPQGEMVLAVTATTAVNFLLVIEEVA